MKTTKVWVVALTLTMAMTAVAGMIITPDHIQAGGSETVQGTLVVIDVPTLVTTTVYIPASPGGPSWTTGGGIIAHQADQGFYLQSKAGDVYGTFSPWEPDGTPLAEAENYGVYDGAAPEVTYYFDLANSGIDIPDESVINGVYMCWNTRGVDHGDWRWDESGAPGMVTVNYFVNEAVDLILRWYDSDANGHDAQFEKVIDGPITVDGGDGFVLTGERQANTMHVDAVVIDVSFPPSGTLFYFQ